jgi:hypothetical protein
VLDAAHGGDAGLTKDSPVYIEFTLANPAGGVGMLFIFPPDYDFGILPTGVSRTDAAALQLDLGNSPTDLVVAASATSDSQEFSLQVEGSPHIGAGGVRNIDVTFKPTSDGLKTATGTVTLRDPSGNLVNASVHLTALSGAEPILVAPDTIRYHNEFDPNTHQPRPLPWRKRFLVENAQTTPLIRQSVVVGGTDAAAFHVYEAGANNPALELGHSPMTPTCTIMSGNAELFNVDFCPTRRGSFSAQITVMGNEGTATVPIIGAATVTLKGDAPDDPAPLCQGFGPDSPPGPCQ